MYNEPPKVAILMATYNGERFISKQIDSILRQTYKNFHIIISDDCSTDNTYSIIMDYRRKDNRIMTPLINKNHGPFLNYYHLLKYCKENVINGYDVYFLCDQDDIWEDDKVEKEVEKLYKTCVSDVPAAIYTDLNIIGEDDLPIGKKLSDMYNIQINNQYDYFLNQVNAWGNTIAFNRQLLDLVQVSDYMKNDLSHDHYIMFYACTYGKVLYLEEALTNYRRYGGNVSKMSSKLSIVTAFSKFLSSYHSIIDLHARGYADVLFFAYNAPVKNKLINDIIDCFEYSGVGAIIILKKYNISLGSNIYNKLANFVLLFTKHYKKSQKFISFEKEAESIK